MLVAMFELDNACEVLVDSDTVSALFAFVCFSCDM